MAAPFASLQMCFLAPLLFPEHFWWSSAMEVVSLQSKSYQTIVPCNWIVLLH